MRLNNKGTDDASEQFKPTKFDVIKSFTFRYELFQIYFYVFL